MNVRIESKPAFNVVGMKRTYNFKNGENLQEIPNFWEDVMKDGSFNRLIKHSIDQNSLGICLPPNDDGQTFDYVIGVFAESAEEFENLLIDSSDYAIFELVGPIQPTLQQAWKEIFETWFKEATVHPKNAPQLEVYLNGDVNDQDYKMEIWIPIVK